jgi:putative spermidine/putrescine transport system permease protein
MTTTAGDALSDAPTPEEQRETAGTDARGRLLAADGTPLKTSLARALRRQKLRAFGLVAPLLLFILLTFIAPIADMLFRSVENSIVPDTLPRTVEAVQGWDVDSGEAPGEEAFRALYFDLFLATEAKEHTALGSRLNYETTGMASLFRGTGRDLDDMGEVYKEPLEEISPNWDDAGFWHALMAAGPDRPGDEAMVAREREKLQALVDEPFEGETDFVPAREIVELLPRTAAAYTDFALFTALLEEDVVAEEEPWEAVHAALAIDLRAPGVEQAIDAYQGPGASTLRETMARLDEVPPVELRPAFIEEADEDWVDPEVWATIQRLSGHYTANYFLTAVDLERTTTGEIVEKPEFEQIYVFLFERTLWLSLTITFSCLLLGYPIAWLLANLPLRIANLLLILVLLPFWTSLLVRTSSWIVLLQQQGVINDTLVSVGILADDGRLEMMFNQTGTIVAMTHILLPFMILPLYSVMKTIPPSYLRAAKSLGATDWTAFWRVYFPNTIPGIGAGAILVFILSIGYYITPELVGGTDGIFISNRIAYHISSSLNWGLAAALASILLFVVLILYWVYDKIVGIDNVNLG